MHDASADAAAHFTELSACHSITSIVFAVHVRLVTAVPIASR
jgi:hypothetical protein